MPITRLILFLFLICSFACTTHGEAGPRTSKVKFEKLFEVKDVIWGFDFLPDGKVILTEREGRLSLFDPQTKKVEKDVFLYSIPRQKKLCPLVMFRRFTPSDKGAFWM